MNVHIIILDIYVPEYKTTISQITRYRNKQLFPDIKTFDEVPNESEYYKTIRNENFMIFKDSNMIIFQSPFQEKLFMFHKNIFGDVEYYKNMEAELKNIECGKNDIIENWFNLVRLSNKITNFNKTK
ncbi:hypothetical protein PIROE2DRAFT_2250 [Piromyces sp. E2]|nr:hypothetical protein PIROE2DRAFT_2250 [Piromyces sp. E2]|eukprot:OUM69819.1 hypothetical protein PIROE2DRAFT_2250 [Piromyces sp. E2]